MTNEKELKVLVEEEGLQAVLLFLLFFFFFGFGVALPCLVVFWTKMLLQISPSLRHVTVLPGKGLKEFIKVKVASRKLSYRMLFYSLLFFTFLLRFVFVLTAVDNIDGENKCSSLGTLSVSLSHTQSHEHKNTYMHSRNTKMCRRVNEAYIFNMSKHTCILLYF